MFNGVMTPLKMEETIFSKMFANQLERQYHYLGIKIRFATAI
jgi:hypothetical protein